MNQWIAEEGSPSPLGLTWLKDEQAVNFALYSKHATELETIEAEIAKMARFLPDDHDFQANVRRLPSRWADVLGVKVPQQVGGQRGTHFHQIITFDSSGTGPSSVNQLDNGSFSAVYRAIRRWLTRRIHKHHERCVEQMGRGIWLSVTGREFDVRHFCPEAYALLLWRMLWKNIDVPQKLFLRQLLLVRTEIGLGIDWIPSSIPEEARVSVFGLE